MKQTVLGKSCTWVRNRMTFFGQNDHPQMSLKKSENAMISNVFRNLLIPISVFYLAKYYNADFNTFFWLWVIFNWTYSLIYLSIVLYYLRNQLDKSRGVINPRP